MRRERAALRLRGLLRKEVLQIRRDPSSLLLALVLPVVMLFLFGYGVSLDPRDVPIALVLEDDDPSLRDLAARFELSPYFVPHRTPSAARAERWMRAGRVDAVLRARDDFGERLAGGAPVQLVVNGVDANRARLVEGYAAGVVEAWRQSRRARGEPVARPEVELVGRIWFNATAESTNFLVPGLLTLVMTLIGVLLTALVIAREWERGTMEGLLGTPLRSRELLLGKMLPYFGLGLGGMALSVALAVGLFGVPFRGSLGALLLLSSLFLLASLGLGLFLSAAIRVQFVAAQASVVVGFLPAFFLSGLLFDLESTPAAIRAISHAIPARYFVEITHTLFLAGDLWSVLAPKALALLAMAVLFLALARRRLGLRLEE